MRCATARTIVLAMKLGHTLEDAVALAVEELAELGDGFLGGVVIHAVDAQGNHQVTNFRCQGDIRYWIWDDFDGGTGTQGREDGLSKQRGAPP